MRYPMRPVLPRMTPKATEKFWSRVDRRGPDDCWRYDRAVGYGAFALGRENIAAHRVSWVLHNKRELGRRLACHSCDNKWCVNPAHIWPGTHKHNNRDTAAKGRHRNGTSYVEWNGARRASAIAAVPASARSKIARKLYQSEQQRQTAQAKKRKIRRFGRLLATHVCPALLARLDAWLARQEFPTTKTAVVELALREFLEKREKGRK